MREKKKQSAFLPERHILDGVVIVNEVVDFARKRAKSCIIFKVDFEKAYNFVSWVYPQDMLGQLGFCDK